MCGVPLRSSSSSCPNFVDPFSSSGFLIGIFGVYGLLVLLFRPFSTLWRGVNELVNCLLVGAALSLLCALAALQNEEVLSHYCARALALARTQHCTHTPSLHTA